MTFTRRPTVIGGQTRPDDWAIYYNGGRAIGRINHYNNGPNSYWQWNIWTNPGASGTADSLEGAQDALKAAVMALPPEDRCRHVTPGMRLRREA